MPVRFMRNMLLRNRIPNGLLFWGPSGVGKGLAAMELAKAVNCTEAEADACGECLMCRKIGNGNHPDIMSVQPVKKARIIDVEAIDGIIELASLRPYESTWRIFIIHDAERMRGPAQNHLLKTLEEPLGNTLFILLSEYPQLLLPTIRSRCQSVRFGNLGAETVKRLLLRDRELDSGLAEAIASISQGQMSRAFDLADSDKRAVVFDVLERLIAGEDPLAVSEEFAQFLGTQKSAVEASVKEKTEASDSKEMSKEDREQLKESQMALVDALCRRGTMEFLYLLELWYRDVMVYAATGDTERVLNRDRVDLLEATPEGDPAKKIEAIEKARIYLERFITEDRVFRDLFFTLAS